MSIHNPYENMVRNHWLQGCMHIDVCSPANTGRKKYDVADAIKSYGPTGLNYKFLMFTPIDAYPKLPAPSTNGPLLISGCEFNGNAYKGHALLGNVDASTYPLTTPPPSPDHISDATIAAVNKANGFVIAAHPAWSKEWTWPFDRLRAQGLLGIEIYAAFNGSTNYGYPGGKNGGALAAWDVLALNQTYLWGFAGDDGQSSNDDGFAWIWVNSKQVDPQKVAVSNIVDSIRSGCFYSAAGVKGQGPEILNVTVDSTELITIETQYADYYTVIVDGERGESNAIDGKPITKRFDTHDRFIRFEIEQKPDPCASTGISDTRPRIAWTQHFRKVS